MCVPFTQMGALYWKAVLCAKTPTRVPGTCLFQRLDREQQGALVSLALGEQVPGTFRFEGPPNLWLGAVQQKWYTSVLGEQV